MREEQPPGGTMAERIAAALRDEIASGRWAIDDQLPAEHQLMERFGVSRPSCREALRILQSEGLVKVVRGNRGGARVLPPDPARIASYASVFLQMRHTTIAEVFETRMVVEPAAVRSFTRVATPELLSQLAQNVASQRFLIHDRPAFYRRGRDFRELFVRHCGSESLRLIGLMIGQIADSQLSLLATRLPPEPSEGERYLHAIGIKEAMLDAIGEHRGEQAAELWRSYLLIYLTNLRRLTPPELRDLRPFPLE